MSGFDYDLITLGAGSGGVAASRRAAAHGARVAICEEGRVGGTCVIRGCVPKKLLMYGAQFQDAFEDAAGFGWQLAAPAFDWPTLMAAKDREIDRLEGIYRGMLERAGVTLLAGRARLLDPHTVEVGGRRLRAERILLATGARPVRPDIAGIEWAITSDEALSLPTLPREILIVGAGYIALEFAGIFHGLGARVTVAVRGKQVLRGFDCDVVQALGDALAQRGIDMRYDTRIESLARRDGRIEARCVDGRTFLVDQVMLATGRRPNTEGLGLEDAGVALDESGAVAVDEAARTSVPSVFAVGDVTDRLNLTPWAIAEGRAFADHVYGDARPWPVPDFVPSAVFSQPPVATVGLSEEEARRRHGDVTVFRSRFRPMKNTLSGRQEQTMMKLVVDTASDVVLGCHMVGPDGPEIIQGLAIALTCGATKQQFDRTVGLHPSAAEEFVTLREPVSP